MNTIGNIAEHISILKWVSFMQKFSYKACILPVRWTDIWTDRHKYGDRQLEIQIDREVDREKQIRRQMDNWIEEEKKTKKTKQIRYDRVIKCDRM